MNKPSNLILCFLLIPCLSTCGYSQGVSVGGNTIALSGFPVPDVAKSETMWAEQQRDEFVTLMNLQIDMIHRDCRLSEQQIHKLRVATKGVLEHRIEIGLKRIREFMKASGLVPIENDEPLLIRPDRPNAEDGFDALQIFGARAVGNDVVLLFTKHANSITDHPKWQQVLEKTLTDEQLSVYRKASQVRNGQLLENAIGKWVSELDEAIYLSEEQRVLISQHINATLQEKVTPLFPNEMGKATKLLEEKFQKLDETVEQILSEQQVKRWKDGLNDTAGPTVSWGK